MAGGRGGFHIELVDVHGLASRLRALKGPVFDEVERRELTEIYNRGKRKGGTPVSTEATRPGGPHGELRQSLGQSEHEVYYVKDYAAHVEYGHRTVNGGYVQGQRYLEANVKKQQPIYERHLRKIMEGLFR